MARPRNPLLIVPIRDRRQSRRILTIRNTAITMLSLAVIVATVSIATGRRPGDANEYGRLFDSRVPATTSIERRPVDVITEAPVGDQVSSDPMLVDPAAREQLLRADSNVAPPPPPVVAPAQMVTVPVQASPARPLPPSVPVLGSAQERGTTIVGDGTGVTVVKAPATSTAPQPVLSGGIFKQQ